MASHHTDDHKESKKLVRLDFTPYYFMNFFLPIFWFAYLGIAATFILVSLLLPPEFDTSIWVPIFYYSLSTAFLALTIACTAVSLTLQKYDLVKAEMVIKVPMIVALCVIVLRFLIPFVDLVR
jgi:quinol-cytochrome oxidoreductase complex cytochrome b subunit